MVNRPWVLGLTGNHQATLPLLPQWEAPQYLIAHSIMVKILKKGYGFKEKIRYDCIHMADIYALVYMCVHTHYKGS